MKKIISLLLVFMLILPTVGVMAESGISITIDGEAKTFDVMPIEENDRVLVPMRGIFEELGATVLWDDATWTVTATKGETKVILHVGSPYARVNKTDVALDVPAKIIDGRTMVPVRFVAETLGCTVDWEDATKTVIIKSPVKTALQEKFDGKKVLFIGNSFIHYGRTVDTVNKKYFTLEERQDTKGGFYQLCKANGIDISVTNWTISSHKLNDLLGPNECSVCKNGMIHEEYLTDKYYDYVFFSPSSAKNQNGTFLEDAEYIEKTFKEANPNVEIICIGNVGAYGYSSSKYVWENREELYKTLEEKGIKVLDWGKIVTEVIDGSRKVPGAKETYTASTFINTKDNYHPNLLTGYITTLLAYCAMTGESAVGQTYNYISDASLAPTFDLPGYVDYYYKNGDDDTNFPEILKSESEMKGIQMLVDEYIAKKDNKNTLDGKKVIFIGNSHTYYGRCVPSQGRKYYKQEERIVKEGSFYELCKAMGMEVSVTNWTFSNHGLNSLFGAPCNDKGDCNGVNHEEYLTDRYYDYVVVTPGVSKAAGENLPEHIDYITKFFREANPDVKFVLLGNASSYGINSTNTTYEAITSYYKTLEEQGFIIADWGKLVSDIINGAVTVPGATQEYNKNSFIVKDGYHPNLLTGYITTLFAYCAITGESAQGLPYDYYFNPDLAPTIDVPGYVDYYYVNGDEDSNFPEILKSPEDMKGLQQLVDNYLDSKGEKPMLDGKKIAFIGDSNVYWGKVVDGTSKSVHEQSERENDKGLFYQICKANGAEVNVLDWAWGSHGLWTLFSGEPCTLKGKCLDLNHEEALTDKKFDYVVIGLTRSETDEAAMLEQFEHITKIFRDANPNVRIIALAPAMLYGYNDKNAVRQGTIDNLKVIEEKFDVTVVDWGRIVKDLCEGNVKIDGATQEYNRNTFVITKDNKHPSLLAGYITSLMTYCAITGEKAEGQPYDFFFKEEFASTLGIPAFVEGNYANSEETTMEEIFNSEADMKGLQQLIDKYLAEKAYRK